ncbi:MAG: thermonuclease family protein [Tumebacillaceae bacterium]
MNNLFLLLFLVCFAALLVGIVKPSLVIRWGTSRTRKKVFSYYGIGLIICFILFGVTSPEKQASDQTEGKKAEKPVEQVAQAVTTAPATPAASTASTAVPVVQGRWAVVAKVVDGDTIELDNGEKVRLIGVNTPETVASNTPVQPYGQEASAFTKSHLEGKKVLIQTDLEEKDQYGRTLAYVFIEEPKSQEDIQKYMFNATLLRDGYAQLMTIQPNVKYQDTFVGLQRVARESNKGLWALGLYKDSSTSTNDVFLPGKDPSANKIAETPKQQSEPESKPVPAPQPAPQPKPAPAPQPAPAPSDVFYKNCTEVKAAGKAPLHVGDPGYAKKLDRDGDGIACE